MSSLTLRHLYGPILLAAVAFVTIVSSTIKTRLEHTQSQEFTGWDYSALAGGFVGIAVTLFYIVTDYREKKSAARYRTVRIALRRTRAQPESLSTWNKDERFVSGVLTVALVVGTETIELFDTVIRYGELTAPDAPAERIIERIVERADWTLLHSATALSLSFEPTGDAGHVRINALYDRDDLHDYLFESQVDHPELPQVLIYTERLWERLPQYLKAFNRPADVLKVRTNHRPYYEQILPTLFNVVGEIVIEIKGLPKALRLTETLKLNHEYAIGAAMPPDRGIEKMLLDYAVSTEIPIGDEPPGP